MSAQYDAMMKAKVGKAAGRGRGSLITLRTDELGYLLTRSSGGSLADAALAGRLYSVCNQTAVTTTADDATTWTGLGLANPTGNHKNAILHGFGCAQAVIPTDEAVIGLMVGSYASGQAAALTVLNSLPSGPPSTIYADDGATVTDHTWLIPCFHVGSEGTDMPPNSAPMWMNLNGMYVLEPGDSILSVTTTVLTSSCQFAFLWEEVDR